MRLTRVRWMLPVVLLYATGVCRAEIRVEPVQVDLGIAAQNQTLRREVRLHNTGTAPVEIKNVQSDCTCTLADFSRKTLEPGGEAALVVMVDTRSYQGEVTRKVVIATTAGDVLLPVKFTVSALAPWLASSCPVVLPAKTGSESVSAQVALSYAGTVPPDSLRLLDARPDVPWLSASVRASQRPNEFILTLTRLAGAAPAGTLSATVRVATNDPRRPTLLIPVVVPVLSDLQLIPNPIVLPAVKPGQEAKGRFRISHWTGQTPPIARLDGHELAPAHQTSTGEYEFELGVRPPRTGLITLALKIYAGDTLQLEAPVLVRSQP